MLNYVPMGDLRIELPQKEYMPRLTGVASRLRILMEYAGVSSQDEMAERLGIKKTNWNNMIHRSDRDLSKMVAIRIHEVFPDITMEWLWLGETQHMTALTLNELRKAAYRIGEEFPGGPSGSRRR